MPEASVVSSSANVPATAPTFGTSCTAGSGTLCPAPTAAGGSAPGR